MLAYAKKHNESYLKKQEYLKQMMEVYKQQHFLNLNQIKQDDLEDVLYEMLKKEIYPPYISQSLIQEIKKQTQSTKPNIEITLPVNFVFTKVYNNIAVRKKESDDTYSIKYKSFYKDQQKYFLLSDTGHIHDGVYLQKEDFPITIRSFQNGDKIITSGGTKKVSRLFIDQKIPKEDRKVWPIVENSQGEIILIPHIAKNIKYLYTKPNVFVIKYDTCK